jgi:DDE family transposase
MPSATRWSPSCCTASATACKATSRLAKAGNTPIGMRSFAPSRGRSGPPSAGSSRRSRSTPRRRNWWGPSRMAAERGGRPRRRNVSACTTSSFPPGATGGKAIPYGVYDLHRNEGWVSVGIDHDTATFAVRSIRRWWQHMGRPVYRDAATLLITADAGGSNGARLRLWKWKLQQFANRTGLAITVCHFPPGTSKWNTASTARRSRSARSFCSTSSSTTRRVPPSRGPRGPRSCSVSSRRRKRRITMANCRSAGRENARNGVPRIT